MNTTPEGTTDEVEAKPGSSVSLVHEQRELQDIGDEHPDWDPELELKSVDLALYHFLLRIRQLELGEIDINKLLPPNPSGRKYRVVAEFPPGGVSLTTELNRITSNRAKPLDDRDEQGYAQFNLTFVTDLSDVESLQFYKELGFPAYFTKYPTYGGIEIRAAGDTMLMFVENAGHLAGTELVWKELLQDCEVPALVEDRFGFKYQQP